MAIRDNAKNIEENIWTEILCDICRGAAQRKKKHRKKYDMLAFEASIILDSVFTSNDYMIYIRESSNNKQEVRYHMANKQITIAKDWHIDYNAFKEVCSRRDISYNKITEDLAA